MISFISMSLFLVFSYLDICKGIFFAWSVVYFAPFIGGAKLTKNIILKDERTPLKYVQFIVRSSDCDMYG